MQLQEKGWLALYDQEEFPLILLTVALVSDWNHLDGWIVNVQQRYNPPTSLSDLYSESTGV